MFAGRSNSSDQPDTFAPDGSEIRYLVIGEKAQMVHCTLPAGKTSRAVRHRTIEEHWHVLSGRGEIWIDGHSGDGITELAPGVSLVLPPHTAMQFRAGPDADLRVILVTIPPWPGADEAEIVAGIWSPTI